jgi:hypothetical protein
LRFATCVVRVGHRGRRQLSLACSLPTSPQKPSEPWGSEHYDGQIQRQIHQAHPLSRLPERGTRPKAALMPPVDGLAAVKEPRWLALLNGGSGLAPPKGPTGREPGRSYPYKRARWPGGQTRKVIGCHEEAETSSCWFEDCALAACEEITPIPVLFLPLRHLQPVALPRFVRRVFFLRDDAFERALDIQREAALRSWKGSGHIDAREVSELLGLPEHVFPVTGLGPRLAGARGSCELAPAAVGDRAPRPFRGGRHPRHGRHLRLPPRRGAANPRAARASTRARARELGAFVCCGPPAESRQVTCLLSPLSASQERSNSQVGPLRSMVARLCRSRRLSRISTASSIVAVTHKNRSVLGEFLDRPPTRDRFPLSPMDLGAPLT